jgi:hypothetical protein
MILTKTTVFSWRAYEKALKRYVEYILNKSVREFKSVQEG